MRQCLFIICLTFLLSACSSPSTKAPSNTSPTDSKEVLSKSFQQILDTLQVVGSILVYDLKNDKYYSNDFHWADSGFIPASTFKIPNSLIALETGVVEHDTTVIKWDGQRRNTRVWNKDLSFTKAFHYSCVPCYQGIARSVGPQKMQEWIDKLDYPGMQFDSSQIDLFWLTGLSEISQRQQIDFLKRYYLSQLPISKRTEGIAKRMMMNRTNPDYDLLAKTGWNGEAVGWYVGYLSLKPSGETYIFATNIVLNDRKGMNLRKRSTMLALKELGIIKQLPH